MLLVVEPAEQSTIPPLFAVVIIALVIIMIATMIILLIAIATPWSSALTMS